MRRSLDLLVACVAMHAATAAAQAALAMPPQVLTCTPHERRDASLGVLVNNQWNRASAGAGAWQQCLQRRMRGGAVEVGWSWRWPDKDGLYAYPELLVGQSPWVDLPTNDPRFPRTVGGTKRLVVDYDIEIGGTGKRNLAVEFWLSRSPLAAHPTGTPDLRAELMIWTDASPGMVPARERPVATVEIDGAAWRVYVKRDWGDASGGSAARWSLISYHAVVQTTTIRYDAAKFLQDAVARGVIAPTDTIAGLELGNEIVGGSGATWIRRFTIDVGP